jgi:hypothetical protein
MNENIDTRISSIKNRFKSCPRTQNGKLFNVPKELIAETLELQRASGLNQEQFGESIGVLGSTLSYWGKHKLSSPLKSRKSKTAAHFKSIRITPEPRQPSATPCSLQMRFPGGITIEGMSPATLIQLMKGLSS